MYPFQWLATAGDATGDVNHQTVDGSTSAPAPTTHNVWTPGAGATGALDGLGISPAYVNAAMMQPGNQAPVAGTPATVNGPQQGPWYTSDYTAAIPSKYIAQAPLWKNGPMRRAAAATLSVPTVPTNQSPTQLLAQGGLMAHGSGCAGCAGGCGSEKLKQCAGAAGPVNLDKINDFPPLWSQPNVNPVDVQNQYLWDLVSNHRTGWAANHGAAADGEVPVQGQ